MSWQEKVVNHYIIKTGDGETYIPYWLNATKANEYNISEYEFPEVDGSLVVRGRVKGRKFNLEIYFQADGRKGLDHLEESKAFEKSASDPRPWTIEHPLYGTLLVQPLSLNFDNKEYNVTKITGVVMETILTTESLTKVDVVEATLDAKEITEETIEVSFETGIPEPSTKDIVKMRSNLQKAYDKIAPKIKQVLDAQGYYNLFTIANTFITNATAFPLNAIRAIRAMINAPFQFIDSVKNRLNMVRSAWDALRTDVTNLTSKSSVKIYESYGAFFVTTLVGAAVWKQNDKTDETFNFGYRTRTEVVDAIDIITAVYDEYVADMDSLQEIAIADAEPQIALSDLVDYCVANLFIIAVEAKQERTLLLEDDTNLILLAHRLYGLTLDDSTIQKLIDENEMGLNELLQIRKGRRIVWYV